ncbi:hypothetical protein [Aquimarina brevivitae]|uniref:Uncharacterized protein n=1 Tax=Aquimarina brevivitae TaxID=323412 RepID=A0A4Q7P0X5_9FLAO|nr:hypothetical protein [Aquimarina brevivitae]RZS93463.1 hypothetical protein EV197_2042 [Aquimarina brevivitae]
MSTDKSNSKSGFSIPKNYFEGLEDSVLSRLKTEERTTSGQHGFEVPEGYFEGLEQTVLQRVENKSKVIPLFKRKKVLLLSGIAAAIALLFTLLPDQNNITFKDLKTTEISLYIEEGNIELTDDELISIIGKDIDLTESYEENPVNEEALLDYLSENDIENEIMYLD